MPAKRIGRPATGATKTKKSVTIDTDILKAAEREMAGKKNLSLSALVEAALEKYLGSQTAASDAAPQQPNIHPFSAKPHIQAAAGSPTGAEVIDWDGSNDTVLVKINGLSMIPRLNDGDVVPMRHKQTSRNPYMKKGLIYLVEYDGGFAVKRYNTRPAKADERGEEWVEKGKVKVLESINPDFPEIIIKQPIEWVAWLE